MSKVSSTSLSAYSASGVSAESSAPLPVLQGPNKLARTLGSVGSLTAHGPVSSVRKLKALTDADHTLTPEQFCGGLYVMDDLTAQRQLNLPDSADMVAYLRGLIPPVKEADTADTIDASGTPATGTLSTLCARCTVLSSIPAGSTNILTVFSNGVAYINTYDGEQSIDAPAGWKKISIYAYVVGIAGDVPEVRYLVREH